MSRRGLALVAPLLLSGAAQADAPNNLEHRLLQLAQSYSCSPRLTCGRIGSCEEANWLLHNCSWGGKLDRDHDGVPCESLC